MATYGRALKFHHSDGKPNFQPLTIAAPLPLVIGITGRESLTAHHVAKVRRAWQRSPQHYDRLFDEVNALVESAAIAIAQGELAELGDLMNLNHGLLNALQLSTPELEELVHVARRAGALGAKLTGGGGGGSMVAVTEVDRQEAVAEAMENAGYQALRVTLPEAHP